MKKITVIGGGHGQSVILEGLRDLEDAQISAIVSVADDGGSTGRLRALYQVPAMGDIRNVLLALSKEDKIIRELMDFRFEGQAEKDVDGHNLGNLILTALMQINGSFTESIRLMSEILDVRGSVYPSSLEYLRLYALMDDDTIVKGEANIPSFNHHISKIFYDHEVVAYEGAVEAIMNADLIIYGIGSLYTSILPNTIIPGLNAALENTGAKKVYFSNCMTQNNETFDYDLADHLKAFKEHNTPVDLIVRHNNQIPPEIRAKYAAQNSIEVYDNGDTGIEVVNLDLLDFSSGLVRHSPKKIQKAVKMILEEL